MHCYTTRPGMQKVVGLVIHSSKQEYIIFQNKNQLEARQYILYYNYSSLTLFLLLTLLRKIPHAPSGIQISIKMIDISHPGRSHTWVLTSAMLTQNLREVIIIGHTNREHQGEMISL